VRIQIAPEIEDHLLLESVVENDADRIETVLQHKRQCRDQDERREPLRPTSSMIRFVTAGNTITINVLRMAQASVAVPIHGYRFK